MRILIAEDDTNSRLLLEKQLTRWGHEVISTHDGDEAWDQLQLPGSPQMAVIDWMMPGRDGPQIIRDLRRRPGGAYVYTILLTARTEKQDMLEALKSGADDYITKPYDPQELEARLRAGIRILNLQTELTRARETMRLQATHDSLTGLPNRLLFRDRLIQKLHEARRSGEGLGVMFVDLNRFKIINDTLGHGVGDALLVQVAERLRDALRDEDTFARIGGDEFTVILGGLTSPDEASAIARRMLGSLSAPFHVNDHDLSVSASIGISIYPEDGEDVEELVRNADTAMYAAKTSRGEKFHFHATSVESSRLNRDNLGAQLARAVGAGELELHYQPRVDMATGQINGAEALLRWRHPEYGLLMPGDFIAIAEENGAIAAIGEWVVDTACSQARSWHASGMAQIEVAVNVAAKQLQMPGAVAKLLQAIDREGLRPGLISLELSESALARCSDTGIQSLRAIAEAGVCVALDQFGTSGIRIADLSRVPIGRIKIDRSFVHSMPSGPGDPSLAGAIVALAKSLGIRTVADGIETWEQLNALRALGCDQMQGYFISRPVAASEFEAAVQAASVRGEAA